MTKEEINYMTELLKIAMECDIELQLDIDDCEIVEKCIRNLWKIRAYDKIIEEKT